MRAHPDDALECGSHISEVGYSAPDHQCPFRGPGVGGGAVDERPRVLICTTRVPG